MKHTHLIISILILSAILLTSCSEVGAAPCDIVTDIELLKEDVWKNSSDAAVAGDAVSEETAAPGEKPAVSFLKTAKTADYEGKSISLSMKSAKEKVVFAYFAPAGDNNGRLCILYGDSPETALKNIMIVIATDMKCADFKSAPDTVTGNVEQISIIHFFDYKYPEQAMINDELKVKSAECTEMSAACCGYLDFSNEESPKSYCIDWDNMSDDSRAPFTDVFDRFGFEK